jgi:hypothetical protein
MIIHNPILTGSFTYNGTDISNTTSSAASITSINASTASLNSFSASVLSYTASQNILNGKYATTSSNTLTGQQYLTNTSFPVGFSGTSASLYTDGGLQVTRDVYFSSSLYIKGNLTVYGTESIAYITSSQLNISTNLITVNTSTPSIRFGGLAVQDSGSASGLTGSLLWDSQNNVWIYTNPSGGLYDGGMVLMGPPNYSTTGNEVGISTNYLAKGAGSHHMTSSAIFESGSNVGIGTTTLTTNSLIRQLVIGQNITNGVSKLSFLSDSTSQSAEIALSSYTGENLMNIATISSSPMLFSTANTERIRITSGGNVGIGTSSPTSRPLTIYNSASTGGISFRGASTGDAGNILLEGYDNDDNEYSNLQFVANSGNGYFVFNSATGTNPNSWTSNARMVIGTNGKVGIGTTSPSALLHLSIGNNNKVLYTTGATTGYQYGQMVNTSGNFIFGIEGSAAGNINSSNTAYSSNITTGTATDLSLGTNQIERMRITSTGTINITNTYNSLQTSTKTTTSGGTLSFAMGSDYAQNVAGNDNIGGLVIISINQTNTNITGAGAVWVGTVNNPRGSGATVTQITRTLGGGISALTVSNSSNTITVSATTTDGSSFRASMTFIGGGGTS